jgi:hypothetical protein
MQTLFGLLKLLEGFRSTRFIAGPLGGNRLLLAPNDRGRLLEPLSRLVAFMLSDFPVVLCFFELLLEGGDSRFVR